MPRRKKKAHELTTKEAMRKVFPKEARDEAQREAKKARKSAEKRSIGKESS